VTVAVIPSVAIAVISSVAIAVISSVAIAVISSAVLQRWCATKGLDVLLKVSKGRNVLLTGVQRGV